MRAILVEKLCEPQDLRVQEVEAPAVRPGTLRLQVKAAGVNFFDILQCRGEYQVKPPLPFIPGAEVAGIVSEVGPGAEDFEVGDRVFASSGLGGFAEQAVVPVATTYAMPSSMSFEEGAAFPIIYPTSYAGLVFRANLQPKETLLVHAAAGGVGVAAVQIGKALGARVIATAGGDHKLEVARRAGADLCIDYRKEDFVERVKEATDGRGADVIYDSVGGDVFDRSLKCIAWNGRLLVIGFAGGEIPSVRANRILLKNISVVGLHWGAYAKYEPHRIAETFAALFALYSDDSIHPEIYKTYPLEEVPTALADLASRKTTGKLIVAP
ncbi:MAG: NADPH:quinone oxidoreductase family protein [Proteobacteria bacterium]|nr:NADPH:quinone oxidoreductase family protein [Pseudomonadota bacterium]